jgi:GWxTD domain-containing protein
MISLQPTIVLAVLACMAPLHAAVQKKPRLPEKYARWLNEEVVYIISDEEKKDFLKRNTDADRDKFIEDFWEVRNPLRGSKQNPFKEEHYRRLAYANQNFGRQSNTPGWMTDMGRTYILFGKPASRAPFIGHGQIYPLELWFYSNTTGSRSLPPFFYVLFFMPDDIGEYRFYHPIIDGPMKLVRGSQFRNNRDVYNFVKPLGGDLAHAIFSLVPSEPVDTQNFEPSMAGEMVISKIQNFANDSFQLERIREMRYLREKVKSWFLVIQDKPLEITPIALSDPAGQYWLDYCVLVDDEKLVRRQPDGKQFIVDTSFRLLNEKDELILQDAEERSFPAPGAGSGEKGFRPFLIANRIPLVPGKYKLEVRLDNRDMSRSYKGERVIDVPGPNRVSLAGPLAAAAVRQVREPDAAAPFQYFGVQFVPAAERRLASSTPLRLLFQIHAPAAGAQKYQVEYLLAHLQDRNMRRAMTDVVQPPEFKDGSLLKSKTIPLAGLEAGDYRVVVTVRAEGSPELLASSSFNLKVDAEKPLPELYFLSNTRTAAMKPGVAAYLRGLEAMGQGDDERAAGYLQESLRQNPANAFALRSLVHIYFGRKKFEEIRALYNRLGIAPFRGAPETLAQAALSFWYAGSTENARQILAAARQYFPQDALLAAAAKRIGSPVSSQ